MIASVSTFAVLVGLYPCSLLQVPSLRAGQLAAIALAAATAGLARYTSDFGSAPCDRRSCGWWWPAARSPFARMPMCPPRQGPQVGVLDGAARLHEDLEQPSLIACRYTSWDAGMTMQAHPGAPAALQNLSGHAQILDAPVACRNR